MKERVAQILGAIGVSFHLTANNDGHAPVVVAKHNMTRASGLHTREDVADAARALEDAGFEAIEFGLTIYVRAR